MTSRIVDAHMHLWQVGTHDWYPALAQMAEKVDTDNGPSLYRDYLLADYRADADDEPVTSFVHVSAVTEPRAYLAESRWVNTLFDRDGIDGVLIGSVDPGLAPTDVIADLDEQAELTRFRGVRVLDEMAPDSAAADIVLGWLSDTGKVFDLVTHPSTMHGWLNALERYPELRVVLEHTGWPEGTERTSFQQWQYAIRRLATETTASCKISGLGMVTMSHSEASLRPWMETCVETFGWDRVAFGSNFPIDRIGGTYAELLQATRAVLSGTSTEEQVKFFATNAERMYGL